MALRDDLGTRMKENYENRAKNYLTRRTPVIIRIDGKAFHSFTAHFRKPYDELFHTAMNATLKYLCENIQGCKFGYTQSDEISLLLIDYDTLQTAAWFDYNVQKICSIAASMATMYFNRVFAEEIHKFSFNNTDLLLGMNESDQALWKVYTHAADKGAMFDARCFNIPESEICNYFIWRQQDATRNAIQMLGQANFPHKALQGKSCDEIQEMLMTEKSINFNDMPRAFKRGVCCIKKLTNVATEGEDPVWRGKWMLDDQITIFSQDRKYIDIAWRKDFNEGNSTENR